MQEVLEQLNQAKDSLAQIVENLRGKLNVKTWASPNPLLSQYKAVNQAHIDVTSAIYHLQVANVLKITATNRRNLAQKEE